MSGDVVKSMKALRLIPLLVLLMAAPAGASCGNGCPKGIGLPYPLAYFFGDGILSNAEVACIVVANATSIPINLKRTACTATAPTTIQEVFTITDTPYGGAPNAIARLTFGAGSMTCAVSQQAAYSVAARDTICVAGPATADPTLATVAITIYSLTTDYP